MNLPFLRYFKKGRDADEGNVAVAPPPPAPSVKPASERLGKTVMPNTSRIVGTDAVQDFSIVPPIGNPAPAQPPEPAKISLGENGAIKAVQPRKLPVKAETTAVERTIALRLADLVPHLPEGALQSAEVDPDQRILLLAAEVERGMANGRPVALLRTIYQQAPSAFAAAVGEQDEREVALPFGKVLEQFTAFQVRPDQEIERDLPQLETPFLKMTQADSERLGTPATPVPPPSSSFSFAAEAAEPEAAPAPEASAAAGTMKVYRAGSTAPIVTGPPATPVASEPVEKPASAATPPPAPKTIRPLRLPLPNENARTEAAPAPAVPRASSAPAAASLPPLSLQPRISSNGTGGPATERVPASSGSPVPTPLPSPFAPPPAATPVRLPFKVTPPSNDLRPASPPETAALPILQARKPAPAPAPTGPLLRLPLLNVLRDISPFQLSAPTDSIPETAELEIPFSIVQPQLSLGRITISAAQFEAGLPEEFRTLLKLEDAESPVSLPLQDVLANLPNESLQRRPDQVVPELGEMFETPFSAKAAEDAARLKEAAAQPAEAAVVAGGADPGPVSAAQENTAQDNVLPGSTPPATTAAAEAEPAPLVLKKISASPPAAAAPAVAAEARPPERTPLQVAFDTDDTLDAKAVVARASQLPGVSACAIVFSDGLSLAGNLPAEYNAEGLCALAPSIVRRIDEQMSGTQFGELTGITLFCANRPLSFFAHGNICLAALHSTDELTAEIRTRLKHAVRELAAIYAQPA